MTNICPINLFIFIKDKYLTHVFIYINVKYLSCVFYVSTTNICVVFLYIR